MNKDLHDIDKLFKDSIDEHQEMPSTKVWDAIDANLNKNNFSVIEKKYKNIKRLAAVLLLLLLSTWGYQVFFNKTPKQNFVNNTEVKNNEVNNTNLNSINANPSEAKSNENKSTEILVNKAIDNSTIKSSTNIVNQPNNFNSNNNVKIKESIKTNSGTNFKSITTTNKSFDEAEVGEENFSLKTRHKKSFYKKIKVKITNALPVYLDDENDDNDFVLDNMPQNAATLNICGNIYNGKLYDKNSPSVTLNNSNKLKNKKGFNFSITPFFAPQFSFSRLEEDRHHDPSQPSRGDRRDDIKRDEPNEQFFAAGLLVDIPLSKKWGFQTGITYLNKTIDIEPKNIYAKLDDNGAVKYRFDCSSGYTYISPKAGLVTVVGDSAKAEAAQNNLQYICIPFAVNYKFSFGKFSVIPTIGSAINFLVKQKIVTQVVQAGTKETQTTKDIQGLKPSYFNAFANVAVDYSLNKKFAISVAPALNFALSSINKNAAVKSYPNSFGIMAGLKIKL